MANIEFNNLNKYTFYIDHVEKDLYEITGIVFGEWYSTDALEFMTAMWATAYTDGGKAEYITKSRMIRGWGTKPRFLGKKRTIDECYKLFKSLKENSIENN